MCIVVSSLLQHTSSGVSICTSVLVKQVNLLHDVDTTCRLEHFQLLDPFDMYDIFYHFIKTERSTNFNFGEMWCGNKERGTDHVKESEEVRI